MGRAPHGNTHDVALAPAAKLVREPPEHARAVVGTSEDILRKRTVAHSDSRDGGRAISTNRHPWHVSSLIPARGVGCVMPAAAGRQSASDPDRQTRASQQKMRATAGEHPAT
jgi:hypothetical protein